MPNCPASQPEGKSEEVLQDQEVSVFHCLVVWHVIHCQCVLCIIISMSNPWRNFTHFHWSWSVTPIPNNPHLVQVHAPWPEAQEDPSYPTSPYRQRELSQDSETEESGHSLQSACLRREGLIRWFLFNFIEIEFCFNQTCQSPTVLNQILFPLSSPTNNNSIWKH